MENRTQTNSSADSYSINLNDYFAVYLLNLCEGEYLPDGNDPYAHAILTGCHSSFGTQFDLTKTLDDGIEDVADKLGIELSSRDIQWPQDIDDAFTFSKSAGPVLSIFFTAALLFLLATIFLSAIACFKPTRFVILSLFIVSAVSPALLLRSKRCSDSQQLAFITLAVAAGIATSITVTVVDSINSDDDDLGLSAKRGDTVLVILWVLVAVILIAVLLLSVSICARPRSTSKYESLKSMNVGPPGVDSPGMRPAMPPRIYRPISYDDGQYWGGGSQYGPQPMFGPQGPQGMYMAPDNEMGRRPG